MVKIALEIKETDGTINIKLVDPTKKQLDTATDNELLIAQNFKNLFDNKLIELLQEQQNKND